MNKEYAFWTGLKKVLKATELRTQAQGSGLAQGITTAVGAGSGYASGGDFTDSLTKAFVGAAMGRQFVKLLQSPYWRTSVSAPPKERMAKALASGNPGEAIGAWSRISSALPAQIRASLATPPPQKVVFSERDIDR